MWLHVTKTGQWRLDLRPELSATSALRAVSGRGGIIIEHETITDREQRGDQWSGSDWGDALIVTWRGATQTVLGRAAAIGPWATYGGSAQLGPRRGRKIITREYLGEQTTYAAASHAAALLRRIASRGRSVPITTPITWWLAVGDTITVDLRSGRQDRQIVSAITTRLPEGIQEITTRDPEDILITSEGVIL